MTFCDMHKGSGCYECPSRHRCTKPENKAKDVAVVDRLPTCDFCTEPAEYDAMLPLYRTWANVCRRHFIEYECRLGVGFGQKLIVKDEDNRG